VRRRCVAEAWPSFFHPDLADPSFVLRCGLSSHMRQPAIPRFMLVEPGLTLYQWEQFLALGCRLSTWSRPIARASSSAGRRSAGEGVFLCSVLMAVCFCRDSWQVSRPAIPTAAAHTLQSGTRCFTGLALSLAQGARQTSIATHLAPCSCSREAGRVQGRCSAAVLRGRQTGASEQSHR